MNTSGATQTSSVLESALEQLRLDGAIFFRSELTERFAFESTPVALADLLHPGADRLIPFTSSPRVRAGSRPATGYATGPARAT